jgi:hypothetical protein
VPVRPPRCMRRWKEAGRSSLVVGKNHSTRRRRDKIDKIMAVSIGTRLVARTTGCVAAVTGLPFLGLLAPAIFGLLILGAALGRRFPKRASILMWFGAGILSLWAVPIWVGVLDQAYSSDPGPVTELFGSAFRAASAAIGAILFVIVCDTALVTEAFGHDQRLTTND